MCRILDNMVFNVYKSMKLILKLVYKPTSNELSLLYVLALLLLGNEKNRVHFKVQSCVMYVQKFCTNDVKVDDTFKNTVCDLRYPE